MQKVQVQFRITQSDKDAMDRIAQQTTPVGETVNYSLVYRDAIRQYIAKWMKENGQ